MANTLGQYILDRKIATGGMAEIWVGHRQGVAGFEKEVVIKKILPHLSEDPKFIDMFLDEARLAAKLSHPNIAQIFDLGNDNNDYFIAMEFIDGHDVQAIIERTAEAGCVFSPAVAARIIADACTALDYAHTFCDKDGTHVQLVHRDVSPQNILVSNDGIVKLVDFGVAKAATSTHKTQTGAVKGKLSYMSPEQISGKFIDARSDIFALGIVLYELVTGRRPFGHESELLAITAILNEHPPRPRELIYGVPLELEAVILRALEKDPALRFQSASEMQLALEQVLRQMGAILTPREVRIYLEDIFSETPTGVLAGTTQNAVGGITHVEHPSAETRPDYAGVPYPAGGPLGAPRQPASANASDHVYMANAMPAETDELKPPQRKGPVIAALTIVLLVLAAGATGLFLMFGPGADDAPDEERSERVAAQEERRADPPDDQASGDSDEQAGDSDAAEADAESAHVGALDDDAGAKPDPNAAQQDATPDPEEPSAQPGSGDPAEPDAGATGDEGDDDATDEPTQVEGAVAAAEEDVAPDAGEAVALIPDEPDTPAEEPETPTQEAPTRPERPRDGTISIVVPGGSATMYIDGDRVGTYPGRTRFTVRAGSHRVRVEGADGESFSTTVDVDGGETARVRVRY